MSEPDDETKIALAKLLNTTVAYLIGETDNPEKNGGNAHSGTLLTNDESGNIICEWGNNNRIILPDNHDTRNLLYNFFSALVEKGYLSPENVPSNIITIIPLNISSDASHKEMANAASRALNKAFPDAHVKFDVVFHQEQPEDTQSKVSAYNGSHSSYTGNSLTVTTGEGNKL